MTVVNNLDSEQAPQDMGHYMRSKWFGTQIIHQQNIGWQTLEQFI